jgi:S1-C subfamily serine protease/tetratricopeptide (TPR) repeat protein/DNA-directed RNA polymerase subunit RPC12/RpoP
MEKTEVSARCSSCNVKVKVNKEKLSRQLRCPSCGLTTSFIQVVEKDSAQTRQQERQDKKASQPKPQKFSLSKKHILQVVVCLFILQSFVLIYLLCFPRKDDIAENSQPTPALSLQKERANENEKDASRIVKTSSEVKINQKQAVPTTPLGGKLAGDNTAKTEQEKEELTAAVKTNKKQAVPATTLGSNLAGDNTEKTKQEKRELTASEIYALFKHRVFGVDVYRNGKKIKQGTGFEVFDFFDNFGSDDITKQRFSGIVTNFHVVQGGDEIFLHDHENIKWGVTGFSAIDPSKDIAILIKGQPTDPLEREKRAKEFAKAWREVSETINKNESDPNYQEKLKKARAMPRLREIREETTCLSIGKKVFTIGSPQGLDFSLSEGIISGYRELENNSSFIQITTPISHGSSGGPLFSAEGQIVGITTASVKDGQNLNLAIPTHVLLDVAKNKPDVDMIPAFYQNSASRCALEASLFMVFMKDKSAILDASNVHSLTGNDDVGLIERRQSKFGICATDVNYFEDRKTPHPGFSKFAEAWEFEERNDFIEAAKRYEEAAFSLPDKYKFIAYYRAADCYRLGSFGKGKESLSISAKGIERVRSAIKYKSDFPASHKLLGQLYDLNANFSAIFSVKTDKEVIERAVISSKTAVDIYPFDPDLWYAYGLALQRSGSYSRAIDASNKAIELGEITGFAFYAIGECYYATGNYDEALRAYKEAFQRKTEYGHTVQFTAFSMGKVYYTTGNLKLAQQYFQMAIDKGIPKKQIEEFMESQGRR